ncbi:hypothetical protein F5Y10DRAFT_234342 [Nemania abortiva]|nr:hypothetical protein F5Y10DRAFT_234342 [Nemania abortiva]
MNDISATNIDLVHNIILGIYIAIFVASRANQIRYLAATMADASTPHTPPRKLFKPASKTKTPTRLGPSRQSTQRTVDDTPRSLASESTRATPEPYTDNVSGSTDETASYSYSAPSSKLSPSGGSARESADGFSSPTRIAKYFTEQGNPEMSNFVTSLIGNRSPGSSENTPRVSKSPVGETQNQNNQVDQAIKGQKNDEPDLPSSQRESQQIKTPNLSEPANISKTAAGTFRDTKDSESIVQPTNKMGEPNVSNISETAQPPALKTDSNTTEQLPETTRGDDEEKGTQVFDNMGRPAHVERSIEIPFQKPGRGFASPPQPEKQRTESQDLGDFEDLPSAENLPSTEELPNLPDDDSQDPPEEVLDPSVHSASSSITPIPKIPKIPHIDASPPVDLLRLSQGLAGHTIDDVGNIVDESGEVLGHATGDLPAMVGKKVSGEGEVYGDGGEIIGYVSENFVNPPPPTEIPGDVLGALRVDHKGNILDSDGNIIGRFHQPPGSKSLSRKPSAKPSSPKAEPKDKSKEEQKPKVNAQTGGSPSDLFLDVKSTNDGIQLTIRIPTTFSRSSSESE